MVDSKGLVVQEDDTHIDIIKRLYFTNIFVSFKWKTLVIYKSWRRINAVKNLWCLSNFAIWEMEKSHPTFKHVFSLCTSSSNAISVGNKTGQNGQMMKYPQPRQMPVEQIILFKKISFKFWWISMNSLVLHNIGCNSSSEYFSSIISIKKLHKCV